MIRINLLPVRQWRRKEAVRRQIPLFFLTLLLLLSVLLGLGITVQGRLSMKRDEVAALEQQKRELAYVNKKIAEVKKKHKEIENKFSSIERLQHGRNFTVRAFDEVVTAMPIDRVWLADMNLNGNQMTLSGVALDNHTVALFMKRLERSSMVSDVTLGQTTKKRFQGKEFVQFSMSIRFREFKTQGVVEGKR